MSTLLNSPAVCKQAGITYRQLDHWVTNGYLRPHRRTQINPGAGTHRKFTQREARIAQIMASLTTSGMRPGIACKVARGLSAGRPVKLGNLLIEVAADAA